MAYPRPAGGFGPPGYGAPNPGAFPPQYGAAPQPGPMNAFPPQQQPQPQPGMMMGGPQMMAPGKMPAAMPGQMQPMGGFPPRGPASVPGGGGAFPPGSAGPAPGPASSFAPQQGMPMMGGPAGPGAMAMGGGGGGFPSTGAGAAPRPTTSFAPPQQPQPMGPMGGMAPMGMAPGAAGAAPMSFPMGGPGGAPRPAAMGGPAPGFPPQQQPLQQQMMPQQQQQPQQMMGGPQGMMMAPRPGAMGPGSLPAPGPVGVAAGQARPPFMMPGQPQPQSVPQQQPPQQAAPPQGPGMMMNGGPRPGMPMQPMQPQQQQQPMQPMQQAPRPGFFPGAAPGPVSAAPAGMAGPGPMANGPFGAQQAQPQPMQPQHGYSGSGGMPQGGPMGMGMGMGAPMGMGPTPTSSSSSASIGSAPGMGMGMGVGGGTPTVPLADVNPAFQCRPAYMSLTVGAIPATKQLLARSSLPFGLAVHPLAEGEGSMGPGGIPLVSFGSGSGGGSGGSNGGAAGTVVRCKKCRAYINPFSKFVDGGRRWRCNLCSYVNDTPQNYYAPTDAEGNRVDLHSRPELTSGSVEFSASSEYMMRPPQPPVYLFVLDCTYGSVASGVLQAAVETIRACLGRLPGNDRTQVGFITYDSAVHYYNLKATLKAPQQIVVADVNELFVPVPEDLLVNLAESRPLVDALLASLPSMFAMTRNSDSALGAALDAAFQVCQHIGGKMIVLSTSLPSVGPGKLKLRETPKMLGSDKEHTLLAPDAGEDGAFYKNKAVDFSRQQISCDTFLFGSIGSSSGGYVDVATVGALSRYTAGQCYYYGPTYLPNVDGPRFAADLKRDLLRTTGFESVMRIRCSKGVSISNFYGNFFIRGTDLLALPNVTPATAFNVELSFEPDSAGDNSGAGQGGSGASSGGLAPGSTISVQAALLYTSTTGERRICVHTLCKPVTQLVTDLFRGVDVDALCNTYAKIALDHALRQGIHMARRYLHTSLVDLVRAYRAATSPAYGGAGGPGAPPSGMMGHRPAPGPMGMGGPAGGAAAQALQQAAMSGDVTAMLPENLQLLPLYILALIKSPLYRGGDAIRSDERSSLVYRMLTMPVTFSRLFVYPRLYALHDIEDQCGRPDPAPTHPMPMTPPHPSDTELQTPPVVLPPALNLTAERLSTEGVYLLDSGGEMFLWCGRGAPQQLLMALFGVPSLDGIDINSLTLQPQGNDYSLRVCAIVNTLRTYSAAAVSGQQQKLRIVKEGARDGNEQRFHWCLVEDKQPFPGGDKAYGEYLPIVARDSHASALAGVGMGGVAGPGGY